MLRLNRRLRKIVAQQCTRTFFLIRLKRTSGILGCVGGEGDAGLRKSESCWLILS